jgi:hypothetical protein
MDKTAFTTISILKTTRDKLSNHMKHEQTYDEYINEILNIIDQIKLQEVK